MAQDQQQTPAITTTPAFAVHRRERVLVRPAGPTPRETRRLSDIDNQTTLRRHMPSVFFYRRGAGDDDPADVIRRALGEALVPYYPLAGRLREVEDKKLVVDCTGDGVAFVEADADVRLAELEAAGGGPLMPPFGPWIDHLLCDEVRSGAGVLNCPLLFIQVTRLLCGGFVLALHRNHNIVDGTGQGYFLSAVAELARGGHPAPTTTAPPPWSRELLEARVPPRPPAFPHPVYDAAPSCIPPALAPPEGDMVARAFTFTRHDVAAIKGSLPTRRRGSAATTFEVLTAALWRAHTAALELPAHEEVRLAFAVGFRGVRELGLPAGYYGNVVLPSAMVTTAGELQASSLGDTVEMVREAKAAAVTAEYVRSTIDLLVLRGRPSMLAPANLLVVSDHRHLGLHRLDLGWGVPVYGGIATVFSGAMFLVAVRDGDGEEDAVAVPIMLPRPAMDRFVSELEKMVSPSLVDEHSSDDN
ncbi:(Z)-3-hexen-1-ol acetyltransferase [Sorghum bicolor]|uniref:Uncharacterized protein n=1 Tax=Sorghum bicolor TaxID=4558 RepID=A0A1B6P6P9_SORBI|nr:(Z)-3-hexen-1-ol acetyltransferase [Sorghum bicolor]KXG21261.1 hypothetical protein SORBI_3009G037300 [Sorghum bicolor]|eukprot:XP_021303939.1 (Z)-3-hexen-1-ol acetyltransferase [Sorghum bicolor]